MHLIASDYIYHIWRLTVNISIAICYNTIKYPFAIGAYYFTPKDKIKLKFRNFWSTFTNRLRCPAATQFIKISYTNKLLFAESATRGFYTNWCSQKGVLKCLWSANFIKKKLWHRCFPMNFTKYLKTSFYRTPLDYCFYICSFAFETTPFTLLSYFPWF